MPNVTDPIADLLTRVRNGLQADHEFVVMQASKLRVEVARILAAQGYIEDYSTEADSVGQVLRIRLKYTDGRQPVITGLRRVSRPGRRTNGYEKRLEIQGVGYRAALRGRDIELQVGYSHPVTIPAPEGIDFEVPAPTQIVVRGISKQQVGEIAARIRKVRPPEPYKGKGI